MQNLFSARQGARQSWLLYSGAHSLVVVVVLGFPQEVQDVRFFQVKGGKWWESVSS